MEARHAAISILSHIGILNLQTSYDHFRGRGLGQKQIRDHLEYDFPSHALRAHAAALS